MNKNSLINELEFRLAATDNAAYAEALRLANQLDEPNTSATHLSEQLKTVQEALEESALFVKLKEPALRIEKVVVLTHVEKALSLLPAIIEGVRGMERQTEGELAELHALDFEGDETLVTFAVPHGTRWSAGQYSIAAIQHPEGEK